MGYWIMPAVETAMIVALIAVVAVIVWDRNRLRSDKEQLHRWLKREQELRDEKADYADKMEENAAAWRERAEKALIEAERARKECAMHEKERRQLEAKILHMKEEYEAQAARADELMQREMANFLGYNGTERGQKELNDGADE